MPVWAPPVVTGRIDRDLSEGRAADWIDVALRTKSPLLREVMARKITHGALDAAELRARVLAQGTQSFRPEAASVVAALGTVWAAGSDDVTTMAAGRRLLRDVLNQHGHEYLSRAQRQVFAQVSYLLEAFADVEEALRDFDDLPKHVRQSLRTDMVHPSRDPARLSDWRNAFAAPFVEAGLVPPSVDLGQATTFDGLSAASVNTQDGPKVSVLVPCYRPDVGLLTSVRSVLAQTYANLEILLVDDASGPEYEQVFDRALVLDPRVRFIRMPTNGGPYLARNAALREARGDLITVQDADDWSHPSRIADQVRLLEDNPRAGGSQSEAIRAKDDLTHQWVGYSPRRPNASSLMFRRRDLERTGPFDAVRRSGDSEFHERLERLIGPVVNTKTPLAITRLRSGTLSRGDFTYRWMHPDRLLYRAAYRSWHRTLASAQTGGPPRIGEPQERPFPAPSSFLPVASSERAARVDVLLVLDASRGVGVEAALVLATEQPESRFGILHLENATLGRSQQPVPRDGFLRLARSGDLPLFGSADKIQAETTILLNPAILAPATRVTGSITTSRVLAVASPPDVGKPVQDLLTAAGEARVLLGYRPTWCAFDEKARRRWQADGWNIPLLTDELRTVSSVPTGR